MLTLQEYLTRLRNRKQAQETRKNERIQEERKKQKLIILAKRLGIQGEAVEVFRREFSEGSFGGIV